MTRNSAQRASPRLGLWLATAFCRGLLRAAAWLFALLSPHTSTPTFTRTVAVDGGNEHMTLHFYVPKDSEGKRRTGRSVGSGGFPAVIGFHGGGFAFGAATDDARFAHYVTDKCGAVYIGVEYRLAPEYRFPAAVDDAAAAIRWVARYAADLGIDRKRLATAGFSAGANLALTGVLRLRQWETAAAGAEETGETEETETEAQTVSLLAAVCFYPPTDYTLSRAQRRQTCVRPDATLPAFLTDIFDEAYLGPDPVEVSVLADPLLSPACAADDALAGLPPHIVIYTCELDMLQREGAALADRLAAPPLGKDVHHRMIAGVVHAWDKKPMASASATAVYEECCAILRRVFAGEETG